MTRRDFFRNSALALFGFAILPGAGRVWHSKRVIRSVLNPEYVNAPFEMRFIIWPDPKILRFDAAIVYNDGNSNSIDPYPLRFNKIVNLADHAEIQRESIPPFIVWEG